MSGWVVDGNYLQFLRWIWEFPSRSRPQLLAILGTYSARSRIVHLRSTGEVREFLGELRPGDGASGTGPSAMMGR